MHSHVHSLVRSASSARLELLQTESHLLPTTSSNSQPKAELDAVLSPAEAAATTDVPSRSQRTGRTTSRRMLAMTNYTAAIQQPPTLTQRLMHPFRVLAAEQMLSSGATQLQPVELVMTCSVVGMGLLGAVWCAPLPSAVPLPWRP